MSYLIKQVILPYSYKTTLQLLPTGCRIYSTFAVSSRNTCVRVLVTLPTDITKKVHPEECSGQGAEGKVWAEVWGSNTSEYMFHNEELLRTYYIHYVGHY